VDVVVASTAPTEDANGTDPVSRMVSVATASRARPKARER